jgi:hypothetical protein
VHIGVEADWVPRLKGREWDPKSDPAMRKDTGFAWQAPTNFATSNILTSSDTTHTAVLKLDI